MDYMKLQLLVGLAVLLLVCTSIEARPGQPAQRRQYQVNDAEAAASDWDHDNDGGSRRHHGHHGHHGGGGVTGPIHTFVKTDKHANYKWGVRHHVGNKYS